MRYRPEQKQEARARIVAAAGRGFRKRGFGGIGVDGLAKEANVTSGAFYGYFASKEAAFGVALALGLDELRGAIEELRQTDSANWIEKFVDFYLGEKRLCDLGESCSMQSLTGDVQRANPEIREAFEASMKGIVEAVAAGLPEGNEAERTGRAWALLSILSGGVTMARAVVDVGAAAQIANGVRAAALLIAGAGGDKNEGKARRAR